MMAAGQRLQLMDTGGGGGGGGSGGGGNGGANQVPFSHILMDTPSGYILDHSGLVIPGAATTSTATFRFDPHHIIATSSSSNTSSNTTTTTTTTEEHLELSSYGPPPPPSSKSPHKYFNVGDDGGASHSFHVHFHGTASSTTVWMDERLWSRLPEKLLHRILALLPLPAFFRLRLVCKRWYSLLFSDSFLELCSRVAPPRHCFLLFRPGIWSQGILFDPDERSWYLLPLGFLPPHVAVVSSSHGLLCCMSEMAGYKTVIMCNPLTRACLQLPLSLKERFVPTVGLVVDQETRAYRLLAAGDDMISPFAVKNLTTEVFDSAYQSWRMTGALPRLCNLESAKTTFANGCFYCMNYSPFGVLAYDLHTGGWGKIQAPMRRFLRTPNLVECRGRLVMVAAVEKNRLNVPKSIRIWGLQHPKNVWVELERMPQGLYEEFMKISGERAFSCIGHGNYILITIHDCPDMLMYDFYEKLWRWLPRCPFIDAADSSGTGFVQGFAFNPRLDASVYPGPSLCYNVDEVNG